MWTRIAAILSLILALTACSKVTQENYDLLQVGMDYEDATGILGNPDECGEKLQTRHCTWGDSKQYIKMSFVADRAMFISSEGLEP